MRNLSDLNSFCIQLEKVAQELSSECNLLRTTIIDSPTFHEEYDSHIVLSRTLEELLFLGVIVWYLPSKEHQLYLRLELERVSYFKENYVLRLLLKSKGHMIIFLQETSLWTQRSFFGNVLCRTMSSKINRNLRFRKRNKKVRYPKRKRGYDDKGSLRLAHEWKPSSDFSLTELQQEIEEERTSQSDTAEFISGWLE